MHTVPLHTGAHAVTADVTRTNLAGVELVTGGDASMWHVRAAGGWKCHGREGGDCHWACPAPGVRCRTKAPVLKFGRRHVPRFTPPCNSQAPRAGGGQPGLGLGGRRAVAQPSLPTHHPDSGERPTNNVRVCGKAGQEARLFVANTAPLALALALGTRRPVSVSVLFFPQHRFCLVH